MRVQRKYLQLACLNLFLVMSVILCPHQTYAKGKKFKIYFTNAEKSIKLPLKSSQTLSVRYSKKKKASYKIKWESSNPKVVKVSKKGILTPKKTGKSVIRHVVRTKSGKVIAKKSIKVKVTPEIAIKAISCEEDAASETLIKYPNKYRWNVSLKPANASLASVTFRSSNKSIATISKSGVITPLKEGNITMTAKYKKVILKRRFHVTIPLKKLTTKHQKISMPYGTSRTLSVNFKPWNASDKKLTWSTNNDTVAVVDENGQVTTRGVGVAVITAASIKNPSRKCNITITVTAENGLLSTEDLDDFDLKDGDRLMIIAHPDDDLLWGGGNMIQEIKELKETGNNYFVVCLTNGSYDSRARDFDSAMNDIGAKHVILRYPDLYRRHQVAWNPYTNYITQDIRRVMNYRNWSKIVTHNPDGEYGHQHHKKTDELVTAVSHENAEHYDKLYYFEKFYTQDAIPEGLAKLPSDVAQKKHALIFKNYFDRGAIRMYEYFNDYENWVKATDWQ